MSKIERLLQAYSRFVRLPWETNLAGPQRVWFVIYDQTEERHLRAHFDEFQMETVRAGHPWLSVDLTDAFGEWLAGQDYRESYFEAPEDLDLLLPEFEASLARRVEAVLNSPAATPASVVALTGIGSLFPFARASALVRRIDSSIHGRLVVFFPGAYQDNNYRLLDARDGWNYLAVPITAQDATEA